MRISDWNSDVCSSDLIEGPSPISVITAEQISASGFTDMPEVMRSMTQNNGATQSPQSISNSDFTPGAQQVDLRGLGPNHTLVLVNGRRLADRKSTRLNSSHSCASRMPSSA